MRLPNRRQIVSFFDSPEDLVEAARSAKDCGFQVVETYSPFPIPEISSIWKGSKSRLAPISLTAALAALIFSIWFCFWSSSINWPINVGGKPWNSLPAFLPVVFEVTILAAALAPFVLFAAGVMAGRSKDGLQATSDQFVLVLEAVDPRDRKERIVAILQSHSASRIEEIT